MRASGWLERGDYVRARGAARAMLDLDGGACSTALGLLARAAAGLGRTEESHTAHRAHVDSARYPLQALLGAPQARHSDQEALVELARAHGFECVDLRGVFAGHGGGLPGRDLFYDYCHLTPRGIDLAMTAVAKVVAGSSQTEWIEVADDVLSRAAIGAGVHGVHRGARGEVVRHWLGQALARDDGAPGLLDDVVHARLAQVPAVLTPGQLRPGPLTPQHGWKWPWLDAETLQAIAEVTGDPLEAAAVAPRIELWNPLDRFFPEVFEHQDATAHALTRSPWPWTHFALVSPGPCTVEWVVRGQGIARLFFQGRCLGYRRLGGDWERWRVRLELPNGLHKLTIRWPLPAPGGREGLAESATLLRAGLEGPIHPIFGEIFGVSATHQ